MKYSIGDGLAEYGFQFYEKLYEPIFLINKIGQVIKMNEAGRKLLKIAKVTANEIETELKSQISQMADLYFKKTILLRTKNQMLHVRPFALPNSDYILIEVRR